MTDEESYHKWKEWTRLLRVVSEDALKTADLTGNTGMEDFGLKVARLAIHADADAGIWINKGSTV